MMKPDSFNIVCVKQTASGGKATPFRTCCPQGIADIGKARIVRRIVQITREISSQRTDFGPYT